VSSSEGVTPCPKLPQRRHRAAHRHPRRQHPDRRPRGLPLRLRHGGHLRETIEALPLGLRAEAASASASPWRAPSSAPSSARSSPAVRPTSSGAGRALLAIAVLYFVSAFGVRPGLELGLAPLLPVRRRHRDRRRLGRSRRCTSRRSPPPACGVGSFAVTQLNIVLGILVAFFSNYWIAGWASARPSGDGCSAS